MLWIRIRLLALFLLLIDVVFIAIVMVIGFFMDGEITSVVIQTKCHEANITRQESEKSCSRKNNENGVHPEKLTWNRKITQLKRKIIFHPPPF